ncbi:hypothetical protein NE619_11905 [Anaerovorax odorimutans]|uniref:Uncharacterized protein n=1 Tax=Anaerovorax odorimutans TaxID=109327 RepID=A0ABT1RQG2_9FIRM|nr:hypothetical protein [Anaerovorax odorimutans]MCQ4637430.1 hypothetical protein [Anaerovorax odorimutans]
MAIKKLSLTIKKHEEPNVVVGAWLAQKDLDAIEAKVGEFVYASIGWSGSKSCRAKIIGTLPENEQGTIGLTEDRIYEGNFKAGEACKVWKHTIWF